jgi:hypothetical protein
VGTFGFIYARNVILDQWHKSVMLQLEQASHEIDMQLSEPLELMKRFSTGRYHQCAQPLFFDHHPVGRDP